MADLPKTVASPMGRTWNDAMSGGWLGRNPAATPTVIQFISDIFTDRMDKGKEVHTQIQMPHSYRGSDLHVHIHHATTSGAVVGETVIWGMDIVYAGIDQPFTAQFNNEQTYTYVTADTTGTMHRLTEFVTVAPTNASISTVMALRIYRKNAGTSAANPFLLGVDCHFQQTAFGSGNEADTLAG
jgi:hypothetical protein